MRSILVLVLIISTASADPARYKRVPHLDLHPELSKRVAPAPATKPQAAQPSIGADDVLRIEGRAQTLRREQETVLEQLVRDTPDDDADKPEILFRLAEHYARELRFWRLRAIQATLARP